jgi:DNA-binding transcriptional MocR family regulator
LIVVLAPQLADLEGRLDGRTSNIWRDLFALTPGISELEVERALDALEGEGYITRYQADGGIYMQLNYFATDQRPDRREAKSKIPPPPAADPGFQKSFLWALDAGNTLEGSG